jgi:hypothetical protein
VSTGSRIQVSLGFNAISYNSFYHTGLSCALGPKGYTCWIPRTWSGGKIERVVRTPRVDGPKEISTNCAIDLNDQITCWLNDGQPALVPDIHWATPHSLSSDYQNGNCVIDSGKPVCWRVKTIKENERPIDWWAQACEYGSYGECTQQILEQDLVNLANQKLRFTPQLFSLTGLKDSTVPDLTGFKLGSQTIAGQWIQRFTNSSNLDVMDRLTLANDGTGRVWDVRQQYSEKMNVKFQYWTREDITPKQLVIKAGPETEVTWPLVWWFGSGWQGFGNAGSAAHDYLHCIYEAESGKLLMNCNFPNSSEFPKAFDPQYYFSN